MDKSERKAALLVLMQAMAPDRLDEVAENIAQALDQRDELLRECLYGVDWSDPYMVPAGLREKINAVVGDKGA